MSYQIDTAQINNIARRDVNRLTGSVAKCLAANSPFINVLRGGTFKSGVSDTQLSAVEMQAAPGDSLAEPTFTAKSSIGGNAGTADNTGKVDYSYTLEAKRGTGPKINVQQGYSSFKSSYLTAEDAMRKLITQYVNADVQAQLHKKSASKFTCKAGQTFAQNFGGGTETDVGRQWGGTGWTSWAAPDAALSFKALHAIARYLKEALFGEMFPSDGKVQPHFRFIGSSDIIESFRNEVGVQNVLLALTTGSYKLGEESSSGYSFETSPAYRGISFGVTQRPLRFTNATMSSGYPVLINPVTVVNPSSQTLQVPAVTVNSGDTGANTGYAVANTSWLSATYEIGFLIAEGSFERQTPEQYTGEGTFKFAPQLWGGELQWHYQIDNDTNVWGDFGWHKYQIIRAYKPLRPQHIIPIMYKRPSTDLGLTAF